MKINYKIEAADFLAFQLFTASTDDIIQKRKRKSRFFYSILFGMASVFCILNDTLFVGIYFGILAITMALFYPHFFRWRYKKQYANFIERNYSKRFGEPAELEITKDFIYSKDKVADGKVKLSEIESIHETALHFFIKMCSGMSFILPKRELESIDLFKETIQQLGLKIVDAHDYKL